MFTITSHVDIHDHRFTVTPPPPILDSSKPEKQPLREPNFSKSFCFIESCARLAGRTAPTRASHYIAGEGFDACAHGTRLAWCSTLSPL